MSQAEWESLCDGCGRCCLNKLEVDETGEIFLTNVACSLLDIGSCRCGDYENRREKVPDCLKIDLESVGKLTWLPQTCAYRVVAEGRDLAWWHPLVSGDPETVHAAGISVRRFAISERFIDLANLEDFIIDGYPRAVRKAASENKKKSKIK
jgi:hypothetical protein